MAFPHIVSTPPLAPTVMATAPDATTSPAVAQTATIIVDALAVNDVDDAPADVINLFTADDDRNVGRVADMVTSPVSAATWQATMSAPSTAVFVGNGVRRPCPSKQWASPRRTAANPSPAPKRTKVIASR